MKNIPTSKVELFLKPRRFFLLKIPENGAKSQNNSKTQLPVAAAA
jgi:hypothetical protein